MVYHPGVSPVWPLSMKRSDYSDKIPDEWYHILFPCYPEWKCQLQLSFLPADCPWICPGWVAFQVLTRSCSCQCRTRLMEKKLTYAANWPLSSSIVQAVSFCAIPTSCLKTFMMRLMCYGSTTMAQNGILFLLTVKFPPINS